ncbi:MAG: hypothetical protein M1134_01115 [Actinobacteria bacterium]|nr:hypothetical protein [Actinomycetota bacterium]MCL5445012.1 hypothetical protein [Actinomycetota bacterium]
MPRSSGRREKSDTSNGDGRAARREMTAAHKAALARGRQEGAVVRRYLELLETTRPKRGRKRTKASIKRQLEAVDKKLETADQLARLHLIQQRKNLHAELADLSEGNDRSELEDRFVKIARSYGERKGISYSTWRDMGVSASVLARAGVPRLRG